jgi:hypothetical protein
MNYRFSGHESFPFRYTWLPKAIRGLQENPCLFSNDDDDEAMVSLGIGKNMVRSMRFWVQATGMAEAGDRGGMKPSALGQILFSDAGLDPFLEDIQTLWLLHWNIATQKEEPLFAWRFLLNDWQESEFAEEGILRAFERESQKLARKLSLVTLKQHFEVFLHTYIPTRGKKAEILEDNLDCPLTELELITIVGERDMGSHRREVVYAFRREEKPSITTELFSWALNDFWEKMHPNEKTLPVGIIATGVGSPGQIFKIPEVDVMTRLAEIESVTKGALSYQESSALPQMHRDRQIDGSALLNSAFKRRLAHV